MKSNPNCQQAPVDIKEDRKRYIQNAIELVLSLGDFQKEINSECSPQDVASESIERLCRLIPFQGSAIFLMDEDTSDMQLSVCIPVRAKNSIEEELEFMIHNGFVAWALRERRGITVVSKDGSHQIFLHVMATYSRIRGLFMGILPSQAAMVPDASLEIASLTLRNAANCIESLVYSSIIKAQKQNLKDEVEQKTQQLIHYEKQLVQAQKTEAVAALAGGVAHQFNNALTGLVGNIDLMSMISQNEPALLGYIERTRPIIERMSNLTSQLLAYARGGALVVTQIITLQELFKETLPAIRGAIKETVALTVESTDELTTIEVDLIQMRTAILAIINNANEAIVEKGILRIVGQAIQWHQIPDEINSELEPGEYVCISVQDSGTGMDEPTLNRLFEPFFSTKFEGRGLSMAAVSGIIKRHNGWIAVSSQTEKGTIVDIYLPIVSPS